MDELGGMMPFNGNFNQISEEDEAKLELKLSKYINEMDAELRGRFKALKVISNSIREFDEEEQKEIRKLEVEYEKKY